MAQTKLFDIDRDSVVLVLLEEIADCNLSPRLRLQLQRQTYIEWPANNQTGLAALLGKAHSSSGQTFKQRHQFAVAKHWSRFISRGIDVEQQHLAKK